LFGHQESYRHEKARRTQTLIPLRSTRPATRSLRSFAVTCGLIAVGTPAWGAQLTLAWDWSDSAGRTAFFKVERKTGTAGSYAQVATTAVGVNRYVDTIANDTTYCYRIRASTSSLDSPYSGEVCGSVPSTTSGTGSSGSGSTGSTGTSTPSEIIIDNAAPTTSDASRTRVGTWCRSSAPNFYGADSLYSCSWTTGDRYRWTPSIPSAGTYDVYVRWTSSTSRSAAAPFYVRHASGTTSRSFDERAGGGNWVLHGRYSFNVGTGGYVETASVNGQVSADAVRFVRR
jgi:hypothetical protein